MGKPNNRTSTRAGIRLLLAALAMQTGAGAALAGPVTFIERPPAEPAAISAAIDQGALAGTLSPTDLGDLVRAGEMLFDTRFTASDGAGRPLATQATIPTRFRPAREVVFQRASGPDANGCVSCHHDPVLGGAGDFVANAFTSEGTESADFDNVDPQFSNERGSPSLFGAGLVELLAREMTAELQARRQDGIERMRELGEPVTVMLETKGITFGRLAVAPGGRIDTSAI